MTTGYKTYKLNDFIKKTPEGELDIDSSKQLVREIAVATGVHHDHDLLVDLRQTIPLKNFGDLLTISAEFTKFAGFLRNKIAFIIPNEHSRIKRAKFFIQSLDAASLQVKYFTEYEEAIEWLSTVKKYPETGL